MTDDLGDDLDNWWGVCELVWKASFYDYPSAFFLEITRSKI